MSDAAKVTARDTPKKRAKEALLLARVAAGDRAAFEKLYRRTAGTVYALVRRLVPDDAACAEVTKDVYVRVWSDARSFSPAVGTAENWVVALAHRCAVERMRGSHAAGNVTAGTAPSLLPELAGGKAQHSISLLTPEQAEALELAYLGGRTHAETAESLGIDQATFRIRVGTALSRLQQGMAPVNRPPTVRKNV